MRDEGCIRSSLIPDSIPNTFALPDGFAFRNKIQVLAVAVVFLVAVGLADETAIAVVEEGSAGFGLKGEGPRAANLVLDDADGVDSVNGLAHPFHGKGVVDFGAVHGAGFRFHVFNAGNLHNFRLGHADAGHVVQHQVIKANVLIFFRGKTLWVLNRVEQFAIMEADEVAAAVEAVEVNDGAHGFAIAFRSRNFGFAAC